ncbi:hypothetical protein PENSPDRAFT_257429 [Peniophora sp. CONT]|nr:hypothetical protein PENSPDRAFT_257429 [Peniophora sp. CONT]
MSCQAPSHWQAPPSKVSYPRDTHYFFSQAVTKSFTDLAVWVSGGPPASTRVPQPTSNSGFHYFNARTPLARRSILTSSSQSAFTVNTHCRSDIPVRLLSTHPLACMPLAPLFLFTPIAPCAPPVRISSPLLEDPVSLPHLFHCFPCIIGPGA